MTGETHFELTRPELLENAPVDVDSLFKRYKRVGRESCEILKKNA